MALQDSSVLYPRTRLSGRPRCIQWPAGASFGLGEDYRPVLAAPRVATARPSDARQPARPDDARNSWETSQRIERAQALRTALERLQQLAVARDETRALVMGHESQIRSAVDHLRLDGATWGQIGQALGITRQGARQRFHVAARTAHRAQPARPRSTSSREDATPSDRSVTPLNRRSVEEE